ncbi:MAG: lasso peptide biosynthesis B2 protein [Pseudonocardiaceae bacterium]
MRCRLWGLRATWRVGFRSPPPPSHAWVEAGGEPVCETVDPRTSYIPTSPALLAVRYGSSPDGSACSVSRPAGAHAG